MCQAMYDENRSSLEAAAEAAAKVNAMLIAKGKLRPSQVNQSQSNRKSSSSNLVIAEVDINDVPIGCRNMLTRGSTQEEISKMSGSAVSTRGRYMTMDERLRNPGERALYLCVQGPNQEAVDLAVKRINEIIQNGMKQRGSRFSPAVRPPMNLPGPRPGVPMHQPPPLMSIGPQPPGPQVTVIQEKLYIGLEHAPPSFDVKNKILGVGGSFLQHIMNETGAKVTLRGKGSCFLDPAREREVFEPMHVHIQHTLLVGLQQAKQLAENLIQTVQQEYASFQQALAAMPPQVNPGTAALFAGIQQTSMPGNTLFTHQPGITTFSHLQQQPLAQVAAPGVQQIGHHPGMMAPHMIPVSTPTSVVMSGASLNSTLTNLTPSALITPAPGLTVSSGGTALVLPTSLAPVPVVTSMPVSATTMVAGPPAPTTVSSQMEAAGAVVSAGLLPNTSLPPPMLQAPAVPTASTYDVPITDSQFLGAAAVNGGQPTHMILSQPPQPVTVQVAAPQLGTPLGGPGQVATSLGGTALAPGGAPLGPGGGPLGPGVQLMTQTGLPPPGMPPPAGPPMGQPQPHQPFYTQYSPVSSGQPYCMVTSPMMCSSPAATYTVATSGYAYSVPMKEEPHKRRFTEEKQEEKIPENLLGYQHGPPHLTNLMTSGPPPPATMVSAALPLGQAFTPTSLSDDGRPYTSQANNGVVMAPPPTSVHDRPEADKHLMPPPGIKGVKRGHSGQGQPDTEKKSKTNLGYEEEGDESKRRGTQPPPPPPPDVEREHAELLEQEHREHLEREREQRDFYNPHFPGGKPQAFRSGSPQGPPRQSPPAPPPPPHFEQMNQQQISPFEQYTQNPQEQYGQAGQPPPPQFEQYPPPPQQFHHQQQIPTYSVATSQSVPHYHQSPPSPQPPYSQAPNIRPPEAQMIISQHSQIQPPPPPSQQSQGLQPQFQSNQPFPPMPQNGYSQQFVGQQSQPPLPPPPPPPPQSQFPPPGMQYWV